MFFNEYYCICFQQWVTVWLSWYLQRGILLDKCWKICWFSYSVRRNVILFRLWLNCSCRQLLHRYQVQELHVDLIKKTVDATRNNTIMWKCHSLSFTSIYRYTAKNLNCEYVRRRNTMFNAQNAFWFFMRASEGSIEVIWKPLSMRYTPTLCIYWIYITLKISVQVSSKRLSV